MKKQTIIIFLTILVLIGLGWVVVGKKGVEEPVLGDTTTMATTTGKMIATTTETTKNNVPTATNIYSKKDGETKIKPGVIKNGIYETETFTLTIPEDWRLIQEEELPFSDVHASGIDAIFQLGDKQCYEIFAASTTLVAAPIGSMGIRVIDNSILAATGYGRT
ncbi:MAG: hypothetical protein Q7S11_00640, partial [bacterium]|nr:hypothetical protein [bacterium]